MLSKIKAPSPDDVLLELAGRGDPVAFYSIFVSLLDTTRDAIRSSGRSPEESEEETLRLAARLYREFRGLSGGQSIQEWYANRTRRILPQTNACGPAHAGSGETVDRDRFHRCLELLFQREYSARKRARRGTRQGGTRVGAGTLSWPLVAALTLAGTLVVCYAALEISSTQLTVTLSRQGSQLSVSFGPSSVPPRESAAPATAVARTVTTQSDSATTRPAVPRAPVTASAGRTIPTAGVSAAPAPPSVSPAALPGGSRRAVVDTAGRDSPIVRTEQQRRPAAAATLPEAATIGRPAQSVGERVAGKRDTAGLTEGGGEWTGVRDGTTEIYSTSGGVTAAGSTGSGAGTVTSGSPGHQP